MLCNICQREHREGEECPRCPFCGRYAHPPKAGWKFGSCPSVMSGRLPKIIGRMKR